MQTAFEAVDDEERPARRDETIDAVESHSDDSRNAVELEYLRPTVRVA